MKPLIKWRHQYDQEADTREGDRAALHCLDESLTQQSFTDDANINVIAQRFGLNDIPSQPLDPSLFRDTTNDPELRDVLELHRAARDQFMALPAKLRKRFHNSPGELWNFVNDPENAEEAVRLGLLTAAPAPSGTPTGSPGTAPATSATSPTSTAPTGTPKGAPPTTENPPKPPQGANT